MTVPWFNETYGLLPPVIGILVIAGLTYHLVNSILGGCQHTRTRFHFNTHNWRSIQFNKCIPYNELCSVCDTLMLPTVGLFCEVCALSACKTCTVVSGRLFRCRQVSQAENKQTEHYWVKVGSICEECVIDSDTPGRDYYCSWCQQIRHFQRYNSEMNETCDFGPLRRSIIPPNLVTLNRGKVVSVKEEEHHDLEPVIVLANTTSGSNMGDEVLSLFRSLLNPIQVIDLSINKPENVVRWIPSRSRILAAGGDGTVAWVLNALAASERQIFPPVGILPLGTGNDLSRVLGWGPTWTSPIDVHKLINSVQNAELGQLDRWSINIISHAARLDRNRNRTLFAYNYASIGLDARVALDFHKARSHFLYKYTNRTINYILYLCFGTQRVLDHGGCYGLEQRLTVMLDDKDKLDLPPLQALVLLNIPSWGAGVDLWNIGAGESIPEQRYNDGIFEVIGICSSFHIARLQCGLAQPIRLGQARKVKIEMKGKCAMQVDGEPWIQGPCTITMDHVGRVPVLINSNETS